MPELVCIYTTAEISAVVNLNAELKPLYFLLSIALETNVVHTKNKTPGF